MAKYIDLSHTIRDGIITYQGLPAPVICDYWTREYSADHYEAGTSFHIGKIEMVANTGTYLDAPFHRWEDGRDVSALGIEEVAGLRASVLRWDMAKNGRRIDADAFSELPIHKRAVLVHTGWDQHWDTDAYFEGHPYLTEAAAIYLRNHDVKLVGIDSLNIDDTSGGARPVHSVLLRADVLVVEHLCNLGKIPDNASALKFFAVPVKVEGMGTFPVRAFVSYGEA